MRGSSYYAIAIGKRLSEVYRRESFWLAWNEVRMKDDIHFIAAMSALKG